MYLSMAAVGNMWSMSHIGIETCCTSSRDNVDWIYFLRSLLKSAMCRVCVQLPNSWKSLSSSLCSTCAHVELHLSLWSPQIRDWWNLKGRRNTALSCCSCQHLEPSHGLISPVINTALQGSYPDELKQTAQHGNDHFGEAQGAAGGTGWKRG